MTKNAVKKQTVQIAAPRLRLVWPVELSYRWSRFVVISWRFIYERRE